jgi:hypothetical protein
MMGLIWRRIGEVQTPPPWGLYTAIGMAVGAFASILLGAGIVGSLGMLPPNAILLTYCIGMGFSALLVTVTRNRTPADGEALALGVADTRVPLILMLSFGVGAALDLLTLALANVPLVVSEISSAGGVIAINQAGFGAWFLLGVLLLVLQPVGEGLVFRGVVYPALRMILGARTGFFMTAVWHGVFHMLVYSSASNTGEFSTLWVTLIAPVLAGVYIGAVRAATDSTRISMIAQAGLGLFFLVRAFTVIGA